MSTLTDPPFRAADRSDESVKQGAAGPAERQLTHNDRCDSCGAQAYARVDLSTGVLLFCGHHFTKYEAAVMPLALTVLDERTFLDLPTHSSGNGFA